MKNTLLSAFIICFVVGCDAPQRTRNGIFNTGNSNALNQDGEPVNGEQKAVDLENTPVTDPTNSNPTGFSNCDQNQGQYAPLIGHTNVCQSTTDETAILIKTSLPSDVANRNCIIPTYKDQSGSSTYLGQPQCYSALENVSIQGKLYKNRQGYFGTGVPFMQLPINGVMVMKYSAITPYFNCMNAISNFPRTARCPNGSQTPSYASPAGLINCYAEAQAYMAALCNDFKVTQPYLDVRLKL